LAEILKRASAVSFDQEDYNEQYLILERQTAYENDYEGVLETGGGLY